jgi:hypothetical protein
MQSDIDNLEKVVQRLQTQAGPTGADQGDAAAQAIATRQVELPHVSGGNLEASYLADQVQSLRGAVKYLVGENAYLKSADLVREFIALPSLADVQSTEARGASIDTVRESGLPVAADDDSREIEDVQTAVLRAKALRSKALHLAVTRKVADVTFRSQGENKGRKWTPSSMSPAIQHAQQRAAMLQVQADVRRLNEKIKKWSVNQRPTAIHTPMLIGAYV